MEKLFKAKDRSPVKKTDASYIWVTCGILAVVCFILFIAQYIRYSHYNVEKENVIAAIPYTDWINSNLLIYYINQDSYLSAVRLNGSDARVLLSGFTVQYLQFSPDGHYIALIAKHTPNPDVIIVLFNTSTLTEKELFRIPANMHFVDMAFSPAGNTIALCVTNDFGEKSRTTKLFIIDINTLAISSNVIPGSFPESCFWSKDGRSISIFADPYSNKACFYNLDTQGISIATMKRNKYYNLPHHWNLDGSCVFYESTDGRYSVETKDWKFMFKDNVAGTKRMLQNDGKVWQESRYYGYDKAKFTPDDKYIVYNNEFLDSKIVFVYDIQQNKKGRIKGVQASGFYWYDPNYQSRSEKSFRKRFGGE